jgi:hypothetical protein
MSASTAKIIRRYCKASGAPVGLIKRMMKKTPVGERATAIERLKEATETLKIEAQNPVSSASTGQ